MPTMDRKLILSSARFLFLHQLQLSSESFFNPNGTAEVAFPVWLLEMYQGFRP